jgi:hypothetical protein
MFIFLWLFFSYSLTVCIDVYNTNPSEKSYIVDCPDGFPFIFPTSCSCGTIAVFRFSSFILPNRSFVECFCNSDIFYYGYARAYCCNNTLLVMSHNTDIYKNIIMLNHLSTQNRGNDRA